MSRPSSPSSRFPMQLAATALLLAFASACSEVPDPAAPVADADTLRELPAGEVIGIAAEYDSHAWLGIPFAEPPVGDLRWKAPRLAPPWNGTLEALETGAPCTQLASSFAGVTDAEPGTPVGQEDCLTLNVYAPRMTPEEVPDGEGRLPVMVWIHGGGNTIGSAGFYNGGNLAARQDVIVVAVQYRLGPFGWFRHASLRGEGTTAAGRSGNYGILDQIRALEWVQANIEGFGGDPDRVTIFGESAGGRDVFMLLLSRPANGLFHRAIAQSGGTGTIAPARAENWNDDLIPGDPNSSNEVLAKLLVADGTAADRDAARAHLATLDDWEIAEYLRGQSNLEILLQYSEDPTEGIEAPQMFADGHVLPRQDALGRFQRGGWNQVPVILGSNRDENKLFRAFDPELADMRFGLIPDIRDPERFDALTEHLSLMWKVSGVDAPAQAMQTKHAGQVWAYRFDWDEELSLPGVRLAEALGASHGFEIPFVFGHFDLGPAAIGLFTPLNRGARKELSARMMSYWAEFAYSGDPGQGRDGTLPRWLPWDDSSPEAHRYVIFDTESDGGVRMGSEPVMVGDVLSSVAEDERLRDARERCYVYRELADWSWGRGFDRESYEALPACRAFPFDLAPWQETAGDAGAEATS
ncbi:MAG: carboxylesterase family protein [Myxococcales bacterium]|nr:carboxylesterase family protein [Myxococcales bacterium]